MLHMFETGREIMICLTSGCSLTAAEGSPNCTGDDSEGTENKV